MISLLSNFVQYKLLKVHMLLQENRLPIPYPIQNKLLKQLNLKTKPLKLNILFFYNQFFPFELKKMKYFHRLFDLRQLPHHLFQKIEYKNRKEQKSIESQEQLQKGRRIKHQIKKYQHKDKLMKLILRLKGKTLRFFLAYKSLIYPPKPHLKKNSSIKNIIIPTIIKPTPITTISPPLPNIISAICPPVYAIKPNTINKAGNPYARILIIYVTAILMHRLNVFCLLLNHFWVSLTSKKHFFDAPVRDTHPITKNGGFVR